MQIENLKPSVVCDIVGCNNLAEFYIKKNETSKLYDSLKLCPKCACGVLKALSKVYALKEKNHANAK